MNIDNEGNPVPRGDLWITIAPTNEQLADAIDEIESKIDELESNCAILNKLNSTLTEQIDRLETEATILSAVSCSFWCCLVLYFVFF